MPNVNKTFSRLSECRQVKLQDITTSSTTRPTRNTGRNNKICHLIKGDRNLLHFTSKF